jgi:hypothetical protein
MVLDVYDTRWLLSARHNISPEGSTGVFALGVELLSEIVLTRQSWQGQFASTQLLNVIGLYAE